MGTFTNPTIYCQKNNCKRLPGMIQRQRFRSFMRIQDTKYFHIRGRRSTLFVEIPGGFCHKTLPQVTNNTKALMALDQLLLERLSANTGNLLDDEELIGEY